MTIFDNIRNLFKGKRSRVQTMSDVQFANYLMSLGSENRHISIETALNYAAVYSCINIISKNIAMLPLIVYEKSKNGKERAENTRIYKLLRYKPNPYMTAYSFKNMMQCQVLARGNAYAEIVLNQLGEPIEFWPLNPDIVTPKFNNNNKLIYEVQLQTRKVVLRAEQVLHLKGLTQNGIYGMSPISANANAIQLGISAEEFGNRFFEQGTNVGGIIEHPEVLSTVAHENLAKDLNKKYTGLGNANRLLILEEGMKYKPITINPKDGQFLETRKFQKEEIAMIFNVPPHMLADLSRATFNNIEEMGQEFYSQTLLPWATNWEQEINMKTMPDTKMFAEFLPENILRANTEKRYSSYAVARQWGWMSANDIRGKENMNSIGPQGDVYLIPMNMINADQVDANIVKEQKTDRKKILLYSEYRKKERIPENIRNIEHERRSISSREKITNAWVPAYVDTYQRIINRETNDLSREIKKLRSRETQAELSAFVEKYYNDPKFEDFFKRNIKPLLLGLSGQIADRANAEIGENIQIYDEFYQVYLENQLYRYRGEHKNQLLRLIKKEDIETEQKIIELEEKLENWEENEARTQTDYETRRASNSTARKVWNVAGISTMWITNVNCCEYCAQLNGRIMSAGAPFLNQNQELEGFTTFSTYSNIMQPPLHSGCQCNIIPV